MIGTLELTIQAYNAGRPFSDRLLHLTWNEENLAAIALADRPSLTAADLWPHYCNRFLLLVNNKSTRAKRGRFLVTVEEGQLPLEAA